MSTGIPLQICDVFLAELNKAGPEMSLDTLAAILQPFLHSLGKLEKGELSSRILEKIFYPLLDNNVTLPDEDEDEWLKEAEYKHRHVDGGKLPPKTQLELKKLVNTKYKFPSFNILLYAQNYILKVASSKD